ncbi:MAG: CAP domain-containing protein [Lactobacillaceae bacterium]|jgi:uncharacterized protein YkwD|nr:CAP domain-containing protein [Lactobacillaceae bacterium]
MKNNQVFQKINKSFLSLVAASSVFTGMLLVDNSKTLVTAETTKKQTADSDFFNKVTEQIKEAVVSDKIQDAINKKTESQNAATEENTVSGAGIFQSTLDSLNSLRAQRGLAPLTWDANLAGAAYSRAALTATSGIPANHYSTEGEVIAIGYGLGDDVIYAWLTDRNMNYGHFMWELNSSYTHVGFGLVDGVIVGHAY